MFLGAASVFILVMSKKCSTFAADFKTKAMRMKTTKIQLVFLICWFGSIILMLISCNPDYFTFYRFKGSDVSNTLTNKEHDKVFKDTITPPNNPMTEKPIPNNSFAFRGVLSLEYFKGEYYCAIRSVTGNNYFLINEHVTYLMRLDDPRLANYAVGDTIVVVAIPTKLIDQFSLVTFDVQPNKILDNE